MIRSTKTSLKFSNTKKLENLRSFIDEYKRITEFFINVLWPLETIPCFVPKTITKQATTWLSATSVQCAAKQASGIVRGCKKKQAKRLWQINKFKATGQYKKQRKLQHIYDATKVSKPSLASVNPLLDARFVRIELNQDTAFDGWLTLSSLGNKLKLVLPFKRTKHFNKLANFGILKPSVCLSKTEITFIFELPESAQRTAGNTVGVDIGQTTTLTCSNGQKIEQCPHGHTFKTICQKLARRKKGSRGFKRAERHRQNYINWAVNQLNLSGVKTVNLENIKQLQKFKKSSRMLSHWNYAELFERLEAKLIEAGVQLNRVSPTYTSQRCSACGWVRKRNRKGKWFKCDKCAFACDADLNGSRNISFDLPPITKEERLAQANRKGFYWLELAKAPIVP